MYVYMHVNMQIYSASAALKLEVQQPRFFLQYYTYINFETKVQNYISHIYRVLISPKEDDSG
jgi:hypothetical protein